MRLTRARRLRALNSRSIQIGAIAGLCCCLSSPASGQVVSPDYEALLRRYARGDRTVAVQALGAWRTSDLDLQIHALQRRAKAAARCPSCEDLLDALPLKAAVMLHLDRDEAERPLGTGTEQPRGCPAEQARRAGQIASILAQRHGTRDFARRFFLAMAQRCQWDFCLQAALQWGRDGLARFPGDASLLLAVGAGLEEQATLGAGRKAQRRSCFLEARRFLSEAIAADPTLTEASVRLGRVQWRLAEDEAAQLTLEKAVQRGGAPSLLYLAHLFLGQVHKRAGRAEPAIAEFTRALELGPQRQAAAVALSQLLLSNGDVAGARRVLEQTLVHAGRRTERDPYWDYVASNAAQAEELFEELREETGP